MDVDVSGKWNSQCAEYYGNSALNYVLDFLDVEFDTFGFMDLCMCE